MVILRIFRVFQSWTEVGTWLQQTLFVLLAAVALAWICGAVILFIQDRRSTGGFFTIRLADSFLGSAFVCAIWPLVFAWVLFFAGRK